VDSGSAEAQYCYGLYLLDSNAVKGADYLKRVGDRGHRKAQYKSGQCLQYGIGVERNSAMAEECPRRSRLSTNAQSWNSCGRSILNWVRNGILSKLLIVAPLITNLVPIWLALKPRRKGLINWLSKIKSTGKVGLLIYIRLSSPLALSEKPWRCALCLACAAGAAQDIVATVYRFRISADQGNAQSQCSYGWCLEYGHGAAVNLSEAARYYRLSAAQNNSDGQYRYGVCLEYGRGVPLNLSEAARYYRLSAAQNNSDGQYRYGFCLEYGLGVSLNFNEAARYYRLSAAQNNSDGQSRYIGRAHV
jgi:TPR repeat protein